LYIFGIEFLDLASQVSATSPVIRIDEILKVDEKTTEAGQDKKHVRGTRFN
jgi:hypothetical protein